MKKLTKRLLATVLSLIMAMPVILAMPFSASAENDDASYFSEHLVAQYFTDSSLTEDKVGNSDLTAVGSGFTWTSDSGYDCVKFPGGNKGSNTNYYRANVSSMLSGVDFSKGMTFSFTAKRGGNNYQRYFELSTNEGYGDGSKTSYLYFSCNQNSKIKSIPYGNSETGTPSISDDGNWHTWTVVVNRSRLFIYRDEVFWGQIQDTNRITDAWFNAVKGANLLLGASSFTGDELFSGYMRDFKVYNVGLTSLQIRELVSSKPTNHNSINVKYETAVNFHGTEGSDYAISNNNWYYSPQKTNYGLTRYSTAHSINTDDGLQYFRMWDKKDRLYYEDNSSRTQGIFQQDMDFRFDVTMGSRTDSASSYLIAVMDRNGGIPIQLLKNGNISINGNEITGTNAVYSGSNEKYHNNYTFSFDYSEQMLHFSCYGEYTDSSHNFTIEKNYKVTDYGITLNPGDLAGINILNGSGNGHARFGGIFFYVPYTPYTPGSLAELKETVALYESKMAQDKIYTNMSAAYSAYVLANRYIDAADYGDRNIDESLYRSATDNLLTAIRNMEEWTPVKGTAHGTFSEDNDFVSESDYMQTYKNLVYSSSVSRNNQADATVWLDEMNIYESNEKCNPRLYQPVAVMMYDGVNTPAVPVMSYFRHWSRGTTSGFSTYTYNIYYSAIFLNGNANGLEIDSRWRNGSGGSVNESFNYQWHYLNNQTVNIANTDTFDVNQHWSKGFYASSEFFFGFANQIRFTGSLGATEYSRTYDSINWGFNFSNSIDRPDGNNGYKRIRETGTKPIYVINYKAVKDALGRAKPVARAVTSYKEGGLTSFFTAYDNATSFNPQTAYNWADNTASKVSSCANDISGMVSALDNANKRADIYPVVRTEMKTAHYNHPTGNSAETDYATDSAVLKGTYTKSSVDYFKEVYPVAKSHMYNLVENPYVTSASNLPDIENAHFLDVLADFTALDTAKNTAVANANNAALEDAYTTGSIAALKAYVASAEEFPIEYTADRSDFGISRNSEITAEITKFEASAEAKLDPLADLSELEAAVVQGDGILVALNGARAVYSEDEIGTLITAMNAASPYYNADAATRKTYGTKGENSAQAAIDIVTQNILSAIEALKENDVLSVLQAAIECVEKPDEDVYSVNPEALVLVDTATASIQGSPASYTSITGAPITIATIDDEATPEDIEGTIANVVSVLNTECVKTYTVRVVGDVEISFTGNGTNYPNRDGSYSATYKNTAVFTSNSGRVAWYMEFDSETSERSKQYQDSSTVFITPVIGNITVYAVGSTESKPNRITIARNYSNDPDKTPIQLVEYADSTYTLPVAKAIPNYTFDGYYINDVPVSGTIDISGDTDIIAKYTFSGTENCAVNATALEGGTGFNQTVAYNTKVELQGGENAYAWIEEIAPNRFRPFAIGADVSFFVTESIELTAVTQSQFEAYDFSIPAANLRKEGIVLSGSKSIFNAQIVDGGYTVREHGILIGIAKNGGTLSEEDIIVENAGNHEDYNVFRAKSTRFVGANQFTIGVNGLAGKTILYKAYVIYEDSNGKITTVYSEPMNH